MKNEINEGRKFLKDRNLPGTEQINQHKDFSKVAKGHSAVKKLFWKKVITWNSVLVGAAAASVYLYNANKEIAPAQPMAQADSAQVQPFVVPPIPGKEVSFASYRIDPTKDQEIRYGNNSVIKIPANVFQFRNGKSAKDTIELRYREFHTVSDIFLSGIPMHYDSAGTQYTFESDGMVELRAFDGDQELKMNGNKEVEITMPCVNKNKDFNFYSLDTVQKNWNYRGKADQAKQKQEEKPIISTRKDDFTRSFKNETDLIRPAAASPGKYSFKVKYDKKEFPELAVYDNVSFEVTDNNFKPAFYKIHWDNILLDNGDKKGVYAVKLKKADTSVTVNAIPVFDEKNYGAAVAKFQEEHEKYLKNVKNKNAETDKELASVNKGLKEYSRANTIRTQKSMDVNANSLYYRTMRVNQVGIHNWDVPIVLLPAAIVVAPIVLVAQIAKKILSRPASQSLAYNKVYLAEKGKNAVFSFSENEPVAFNSQAQNLMWVITDKNEFAFLYQDDFKKIAANRSNKVTPSFIKSQAEGLAFIKEFTE